MARTPRAEVEAVVRDAYGRLCARLLRDTRDVAAVEDALGEALVQALDRWPATGVPARPEGWLLHVARRRLQDGWRRDARGQELDEELAAREAQAEGLGDERLELLLLCAHPAMDPEVRTPLMLQLVLGLDARRVARAYALAEATVAQRLVRAKARLRDAGLRLERPADEELPARLALVLEALYAAFGASHEDLAGAEPGSEELAREVLALTGLVTRLVPGEPEAWGLLALMLYCEARRPARVVEGRFVPLDEQDPRRWPRTLLHGAEQALTRAARLGRPFGRYQLEAAIQSAHARRALGAEVDHEVVLQLYDGLVGVAPSLGARVARAAAVARVRGARAGLAELDAIDADEAARHAPWWALLAHLRRELGEPGVEEAARGALARTRDPLVRAYLVERYGLALGS